MFSIAIDRDGRRLLDEARALSDGRPVLVWLGLAASLALAEASLGAADKVPATRRVTQAPAAPTLNLAAHLVLAREIPGRRTRA